MKSFHAISILSVTEKCWRQSIVNRLVDRPVESILEKSSLGGICGRTVCVFVCVCVCYNKGGKLNCGHNKLFS